MTDRKSNFNMKYFYIIFIGLFSFFSCKNSTDNDTVNSPKIIEPVDNYSFYLIVQNEDTAKVEKDIAEILELEKLPYMPTHAKSIENGWTICKLDQRLNSYMFFVIVGTLTEGNFKRNKVYGIGIHKTERAKSFYTFSSGKIYEETRGEYSTGRLESSQNFKYYCFSEDSVNLIFEPINTIEHTKSISELLNSDGLSMLTLTQN